MTALHLVDKAEDEQRPVWDAFPSWAQFSWLFLLSTLSVLRGALFFRFGVGGWEMWVVGSGALIACAAVLRHWGHYELTRGQLMVRNGYTGREIQSIHLTDIREVMIQQGIVAGFFGIGTLVIHSRTTDRVLSIRGVSDPEDVKIRIEALAWRTNRAVKSSHPPLS